MELEGRKIGIDSAPYLVAEMSGNHGGSLDRALQLVEAAAKAGAHALKLQTYTADTMTLDIAGGDFAIDDPDSPWDSQNLYPLYQEAHTPWEWHEQIFERVRELGMTPFSTPFDESAVDLLESLNTPCYKIASFENTDLPLMKRVAATGKPMLISTGMATIAEVSEAVETARTAGCRDLVLLRCTSTYPASPRDTDLRTLPQMRELFGCEVGLSDHTLGIGVAVAAVAFGASVIEKHFTLDRSDGGIDAAFSLEPPEFASLVVETERAWQALGQVRYGPTAAEERARMTRRSLYVAEDMAPGEAFTPKNLRRIRPGRGLPPKYYELLLGRRVAKAVKKGTPVNWDLLEP